jgi:hypothetical protein
VAHPVVPAAAPQVAGTAVAVSAAVAGMAVAAASGVVEAALAVVAEAAAPAEAVAAGVVVAQAEAAAADHEYRQTRVRYLRAPIDNSTFISPKSYGRDALRRL